MSERLKAQVALIFKVILISCYCKKCEESVVKGGMYIYCRVCGDLRWLDWIFLGGYLPSLSLNYVGLSKDMEKRLLQLYYIKMKISYELGFIAIRVAMAT